jgi:hypothetical protein
MVFSIGKIPNVTGCVLAKELAANLKVDIEEFMS